MPCHGARQESVSVLPNGLHIVDWERHTSKLVAIDVWVQAGAREERAGEEGSAHFLEHTLFKGTRTRGVGEADSAIEDLGATIDAVTGPDCAHFYTTVATQHVHDALAILADVIRNATLPEAEVERERGVILDELAQHRSQPTSVLVDALYATAFPSQCYGRSPGGTEEAIRARSRDALVSFYHRNYSPDRVVLAFAGDISHESAVAEATRAFGDWSTARERFGEPDLKEELGTGFHLLEVPRSDLECRLGLGFVAPAAQNAVMVCAAEVARALLGRTDADGRLGDKVLSGTDAEAHYSPRQGPSLFYITATVDSAGQLPAVENTLLGTIRNMISDFPSAAEFAAAKERILGNSRFDLETNAGLASAIGFAASVHGDMPETFRDHLKALTRLDFKQFLEKYLDPKHCVVVRFQSTASGAETKP